jgi:AraC-like DNA-binding protein
MTAAPDSLPDSPEQPAMDALLDLVRAMRLSGGVFLDAEFTSPWCVSSHVGPEDYGSFLPSPAHVIAYHYVTEGRLLLRVGGGPPISVGAGEIILLPRNEPHQLGSGPNVRPVSVDHLVQPSGEGRPPRIVYGGGGERTHMLCGFLGSDSPNPPIASVLPPSLTLAVTQAAAGAWIESSFRFAAQELASGSSPTVLARLAELLFIEAVRRHVESLPSEQHGWVEGLRDPVVSRALALLHGPGSHRWTADKLAREAGASRSVFAERFRTVMGEPPMRYLSQRRLQFAAQKLQESRDAIRAIALDAGYESEAAFSRAFKRAFGQPPAVWRKEQHDRR